MALHLVLLGESVFDNQAYVASSRAVIDHVRAGLPGGAQATPLAVDGDATTDVARQMRHLPADATHLALSVGAAMTSWVLSWPCRPPAAAHCAVSR